MGSKKTDGEWNYDAQVEANETNKNIADENLVYQREQLAENQRMNDYQMAKDQKIMEREDTAVQRQVADARAAGISPLAAGIVGQAASSGAAGNNLLGTSSLHNDYHAEPASKAGDYAMKYQALISMSDALSKLSSNLNQTWATSSQNALREAQIRNLDDETSWRSITRPTSMRLLEMQKIAAENELYDRGKERAYNEKFGLNRGMGENERLVRTFLNGRAASVLPGNLSALGLDKSVNYSVPSNLTFDDLVNWLQPPSAGAPAQKAIGGMQKEITDKAIDLTKSAVKNFVTGNNYILNKYFNAAKDKLKPYKDKAMNWLKSHSVKSPQSGM